MNEFLNHLNAFSTLDTDASDALLIDIKTKTFRKNEFVLKSGQICRNIYFLDQGLVKSFFYNNDKEFIMGFFQEGTMFTELDSYVNQQPSKYMILALEDCTLSYISHDDLEKLCAKYHCVEKLLRKIFTTTSVCFMDRISEMLEENATERYNSFVNNYPTLVQRISLGDLASYIGITQVSLSRIRASK